MFGENSSTGKKEKINFDKRIFLTHQRICEDDKGYSLIMIGLGQDLGSHLDFCVQSHIEKSLNEIKPSNEALIRLKKVQCCSKPIIFSEIFCLLGY